MTDQTSNPEVTGGKPTPAQVTAINEAVRSGNVIVCLTKCWPCQFGQHEDPPRWHTWADQDDIEHAATTGQPDPSTSRCGCPCARTEAPA